MVERGELVGLDFREGSGGLEFLVVTEVELEFLPHPESIVVVLEQISVVLHKVLDVLSGSLSRLVLYDLVKGRLLQPHEV